MTTDPTIWLMYLTSLLITAGLGVWFYSRRYSHLPGDLGIPLIGQLYYILDSVFRGTVTDLLARVNNGFDKYGKLVCIWSGPFVSVAVADPDMIEELANHPAAIHKESWIFDKVNCVMIGAFTKSRSDSEWKHYRKYFNDALKKPVLESYHDVFVRRSKELVKVLSEHVGEFDIKPIGYLSVIDVVIETHFGLEINELADWRNSHRVIQDVKGLAKLVGQSLTNPLYFPFARILLTWYSARSKYFNALLVKIFGKLSKKNEEYKDVQVVSELPIGAQIFKNNTEKGIPLEKTHRELKEIIFVTGHTIIDVLSGIVVFLASYQEVQDKAWIEQQNIFGDSQREPSYEDLKRMEYLERVIKEGCRHIAAPFLARVTSDETKIGEYIIPRNTTVLLGSMRLRMDPKYWENPTKFDPDHFLPEKVLLRPKYTNLMFGAIPRHCPGTTYAINLCKVMLSAILRNFKLSSKLKADEIKFHPEILMELDRPYSISCQRRAT